MITIKFFGALRIKHQIKEMSLNEGTVKQVLEAILKQHTNIQKKELIDAIMMLNKVPLTHRNRMSLKLKPGDELVFMSPVAGG